MQTYDRGVARSAHDAAAGLGGERGKFAALVDLARIWWRWFWTPSAKYSVGFLVIIAFAAGILFWGGFNAAMDATNNETFCISCHEMEKNVYREYQQTIHYTNRTGVRAVCTDCHVPKGWIHKTIRKIQASNEVLHHFLGTIDTRDKFVEKRITMAKSVWRTMKSTDSRECRNCHTLEHMDLSAQEKRSALRHQESLKNKATCIDCHHGIAHRLPPDAEEAFGEIEREFGPRLRQEGATAATERR